MYKVNKLVVFSYNTVVILHSACDVCRRVVTDCLSCCFHNRSKRLSVHVHFL